MVSDPNAGEASPGTRMERDSMGEMEVPAHALYGASTARAVENFPIARRPVPNEVIHAFGHLKAACAIANRDLGKLDPAAPHEVLMVIDGTTGQNAISQVRQFNEAVKVTGLVVTKLDGTAKGGVVFALAREFGIPIRYAGIGERPEDLRVFDAEAFVDALLPETLGG